MKFFWVLEKIAIKLLNIWACVCLAITLLALIIWAAIAIMVGIDTLIN